MGNSSTSILKSAILENNIATLTTILQDPIIRAHINDPLNRRQDTPLALAIRLANYDLVPPLLSAGALVDIANRDKETPVDILLGAILPEDEDILHHHCCVYPTVDVQVFQIPEILRILLKAGAKGQGIERLILHTMKDSAIIHELCQLIVDLECEQSCNLSSLLLQVTVWFDLYQCLQCLLIRGVDALNFWRSNFIPTLVPNRSYQTTTRRTRRSGKSRVYDLPLPPDSYAIQTLKLSFVQDWRAEWDDGGNPSAQYRAGLHLTPESAVIFARSAHRYFVLKNVMSDVLHFLPCSCSGPKLKDTDLINTLALAGYNFSDEEIVHLQLKFHVDFKRYHAYHAQPKPLRHLCRRVIRFSVKVNVYCAVNRLSYLPNSLKDCILLQDGDLYL